MFYTLKQTPKPNEWLKRREKNPQKQTNFAKTRNQNSLNKASTTGTVAGEGESYDAV